MQAQIVVPDQAGRHNASDYEARLTTARSYEDLSTVILCPTRGQIPAKVVQTWLGLMRPMNQKVVGPIFLVGMEVGDAYNQGIKMVLDSPDLSSYRYILTLEEDNMPPPDGLLKLYEHMIHYDAVGGLYWTKGEGGQPMCYGDPLAMPKNFIPQVPLPDAVTPCNGLGMGFTLFKTDLFRKVPAPWFKTVQEYQPGVGARAYTQDLYFFENAAKYGARFACDARVKVGHYDMAGDITW